MIRKSAVIATGSTEGAIECVIIAHLITRSGVSSTCEYRTYVKAKNRKFPKNVVGAVIRKLRLAAHPRVTQEDLVARLEVRGLHLDRTALLRLECGDRKVTDIEIIAIAAALRVPVMSLFPSR